MGAQSASPARRKTGRRPMAIPTGEPHIIFRHSLKISESEASRNAAPGRSTGSVGSTRRERILKGGAASSGNEIQRPPLSRILSFFLGGTRKNPPEAPKNSGSGGMVQPGENKYLTWSPPHPSRASPCQRNYGMIAPGNHYYSNPLRVAPPSPAGEGLPLKRSACTFIRGVATPVLRHWFATTHGVHHPKVISPAKSVSKSLAMPDWSRPWPRPHMSLV